MSPPGFESLILFVSDLAASRLFYVDQLGLPLLFEDGVIVVVGGSTGRVVLHRNNRGHDDRGTFPSGDGVGGAAVRVTVEDPDECERQAAESGIPVLWPVQEAAWGRFVVLADPDGRSVVLARMNRRTEVVDALRPGPRNAWLPGSLTERRRCRFSALGGQVHPGTRTVLEQLATGSGQSAERHIVEGATDGNTGDTCRRQFRDTRATGH